MKKSYASSIQAIDKTSIHNICSGQVILNLAAAVKELVENSLDAGATNIEIYLREYGSESIEVTDNGHGVEERNFEGLTLKHHTSKLNDFSDLTSVETFGFRGEALSSLCALSNMTVVTCHKHASVGARLEYNHDGVLTKKSPTSRQVGTTVILKNLFYTLPVRHKEFQNNLQKEFNKMLHLATSYCLMCSNTRFLCINHTRKGKSISLSTTGGSTVKESIACIFGSKQLSNLVEFHMKPPSPSVVEEFALSLPLVQKADLFRIEGYISSCKHGQGRSSSDRQYFYINSRPFDSSKLSRLVNEVYHSYNRHQYPFVFLNIITEKSSIDVNVTPDKRQIYIQNEKLLLAIIKSSLEVLYEPELSNLQCKKLEDFQSEKNGIIGHLKKQEKLGNSESLLGKIKRSLSNFSQEESFVRKCQRLSDDSECDRNKPDFEAVSKGDFFHAEEQNGCQKITFSVVTSGISIADSSTHPDNTSQIDSDVTLSDTLQIDNVTIPVDISELNSNYKFNEKTTDNKEFLTENTTNKCDQTEAHKMTDAKEFQVNEKRKNVCFQNDLSSFKRKFSRSSSVDNNLLNMLDVFERKQQHLNCSRIDKSRQNLDNNENTSVYNHKLMEYVRVEEKQIGQENDSIDNLQNNSESFVETTASVVEIPDEAKTRSRKHVAIQFSLEKLKVSIKNQVSAKRETSGIYRKFRAKLTNLENKNAEEELKKEISKDMFVRMQIVGQFNKGFIVTKLGTDLFIVDQHATDEKYNYETIKQNTILESQKLLCPQDLNLTAANKCVLLDNLHIFQKNGFIFTGVDDSSTDSAVHLISVPVSHNWSFGKEDVEEMIFMLNDCPGKMCHPSRMYQMFASRACRTSVMIGTALSYSDMRKLINHMGDIEQPWNCPHGRPTMRHLFNMALLGDS